MSSLLKSVQIFPDLKGAHNSELSYKKFDEVQHQTSIYVAAEDIPAGTEITDPRWVVKLDNSAAYAAEQAREEAEALRVAADAARMGFVPKGPYIPTNENKYGEWYTHEGGSYGYIWPEPSTGAPLTDTTHWQQIASVGGQDLVDAAVAARNAAQGYKDAAAGYAAQLAAGIASPAGVYADLSALISANPDHSKIYITLDDGKWCYHNGTAFVAGGVYQAASVVDDILKVSNFTDAVFSKTLREETENWYSGAPSEVWTTSTFSGFATSWDLAEQKVVRSIKFHLRSRAESNITKIRVRIEQGSFVIDRQIDVNIGSDLTEVEFAVGDVLNAGTVWIAVQANQIATFLHESTTVTPSYMYWTYGTLSGIEGLKEDGIGANRRLSIAAVIYAGIKDIDDGAVTITKTDFLARSIGKNIINPDDIVHGQWWAQSGVNYLTCANNVNTIAYSCIAIPVEGKTEVTVFSSLGDNIYYYSYFITDAVTLIPGESIPYISFSDYGFVSLETPVTISIPPGAKYILMSVHGLNRSVGGWVMANDGAEAEAYEPYYEKYFLNGKEILFDDSAIQKIASLKVPDKYDLVVGDTFQLFYKGIIDAVNPDCFEVIAACPIGENYTMMFEATPLAAGTQMLALYLFDQHHNLLDSKNVSLVIHAAPSSPASNVNVLCVGDSLTTGGAWPKELNRRLTGTGGTPTGEALTNVSFIGTRLSGDTSYEGYGGWTFNAYNTANVDTNAKVITCSHDKTEADDQHSIYKDGVNHTWKLETIEGGSIKIMAVSGEGSGFPASGTLTWVSGGVHHADIVYSASADAPGNPFWDSVSGAVDFGSYADKIGASSIDYVYVLLGWNNASSDKETYKTQAQTFINNVQGSFPNAKIVLMGVQIPARDGLGVNYGATGIYSRYYDLMQHVFNLDEWYAELAEENENVYFVSIAGQFDTENNMPTTDKQVNLRNSTTYKMQSNGVHPATSGYMQIADAAYRHIAGLLQ